MSTTSTPFVAPAARRVPLWLKVAYTAFMAVLVPVYLRNYKPSNFLYFCDVALIITLVGIWIESPFLVSMCAVGHYRVTDPLGDRFPLQPDRSSAHRAHGLHVHGRPFAVPAWPVAVSRLVALSAGLSGVAARLWPARAAGLDRGCLGASPHLLLPHAAAARSGPNP